MSRLNAIISIAIFSIAPGIGWSIGTIVYTSIDGAAPVSADIIMALSTGIIIYVIFFEILPKAKEMGATGFQSVLGMVIGFATFLPVLLLQL